MTGKLIIKKILDHKNNSSRAHDLLWEFLRNGHLEGTDWLEYEAINDGDDFALVDFYCKEVSWIITHDAELKLADYEITYIDPSTLLQGIGQIRTHLLVQYSTIKIRSTSVIDDQIEEHRVNAPSEISLDPSHPKGGYSQGEATFVDKFLQTSESMAGENRNDDGRAESDLSLEDMPHERREEINDLIGNAPGWLLRSGIMMIFLVTVLSLAMAHVIKYPDKISATGTLTTERPPIELVAQRSGRIAKILVENGQEVEAGRPLLYIHNAAKADDMGKIIDWIDQYQNGDKGNVPPAKLTLGSIQPLYAQLKLTYGEYREILGQSGFESQLQTISQEVKNIGLLNQSIAEEEIQYQTERNLAQKEYQRSQQLYDQGLIALQELEIAASKYSQFLRQIQSIDKSKIQNEMRKDQLVLEGQGILEDRNTQLQQYRFRIQELISQIQGKYEEWKMNNFIYAEIDGIVDYHMDITEQYTIQTLQEVGYVIPSLITNSKYVKAKVPVEGIAKLDSTSRAIIKLNGYPYKEFGTIDAKKLDIPRVPYKDQEGKVIYQISIGLPDTLKTNYQNVIEYKPEMTAVVELITEDKSVLSRIFEQFMDLMK